MSYLDQARAGDWIHHYVYGSCTFCEAQLHDMWDICPVRITIFALKRAIEEIERLAKERCPQCKRGLRVVIGHDYVQHRLDEPFGYGDCKAQPEQRRIAELREEWEALKGDKQHTEECRWGCPY